MNKEIAIQLNKFAKEVCERYSNKNRANNFNNETFEIQEIIPTSDNTATIIYQKNTGLKQWRYFVPTDSHINGMTCFANQKIEVERHNYKYNF